MHESVRAGERERSDIHAYIYLSICIHGYMKINGWVYGYTCTRMCMCTRVRVCACIDV
jgi:hypothetical protein